MNRGKAIQDFQEKYKKKGLPVFKPGDTIEVYVRIVEEGKKRIQVFEGIAISIRGAGLSRSVTVRKISYGEGVEKTFPLNSPNVEKIVVTKKGRVRRAKLYYLRGKIGKKTKVEGQDLYGEKEASP
ncbi:MAG: 50S ribosomal protein L19, partial [Candidatus Omnitrophica bacterium]|nr:50S ribosomal protein L19 [Candidatus Omnitrophota bacterium]